MDAHGWITADVTCASLCGTVYIRQQQIYHTGEHAMARGELDVDSRGYRIKLAMIVVMCK